MSSLRDKVFNSAIDEALNKLRLEKAKKYKPKKDGRFFTGGITYEIGIGRLTSGGVSIEISSKIPSEILEKKGSSEKFFKAAKKMMSGKPKKPEDVKMENIIRSTIINEIKERDYIKCIYIYKEEELFSDKDITAILNDAAKGKVDLSEIKGVSTPAGRAVIYAIRENMYKAVQGNISDLIKANEELVKKHKGK